MTAIPRERVQRSLAIQQGPATDEGDQLARRALVLRVAASLFDEYGYNASSIGDICKGAGIAKPTLYHYFESKTAILYEILSDYIETLIASAEQPERKKLAAPDRLLAIMRDIVGTLDTHRGHVRSFYEHVGLLPLEMQDTITARRDHYADHVEKILLDGRRDKTLVFEDARMTRLGIFGMCSWTHQWYRPGGPMTTDDIAQHLWGLIMTGIRA